jgi:hypothetical protein
VEKVFKKINKNKFIFSAIGIGIILYLLSEKVGKMFSDNQLEKIKSYGKSKGKLDFKNWTIVGIRGGDIQNGNVVSIPNIRNEFNDLIALIKDDTSLVYKGNLEPGNPSLITPINPDGTFQIGNGFYKVIRTTHGRDIIKDGKKIRIRENAFNIINPIGQRDSDKNGEFNSKDPIFNLNPSHGINIHPTNRKNPKSVDRSSYGCVNLQTSWEDRIWKEFRDTLYSDKNQTWNLIIIDSTKII